MSRGQDRGVGAWPLILEFDTVRQPFSKKNMLHGT